MGNESTSGPLYFGTFERSMDAKKRVSIPSQWLAKEEGEEFYVIPHPVEQFLIVLPPDEFMQMEQKIQASDLPPDKKRKAVRAFFGSARLVGTDKQGRILVPEEYCQKAGLTNEAVFIGGHRRFEIWNKDRYAQTSADDSAAYNEVASSIGL